MPNIHNLTIVPSIYHKFLSAAKQYYYNNPELMVNCCAFLLNLKLEYSISLFGVLSGTRYLPMGYYCWLSLDRAYLFCSRLLCLHLFNQNKT